MRNRGRRCLGRSRPRKPSRENHDNAHSDIDVELRSEFRQALAGLEKLRVGPGGARKGVSGGLRPIHGQNQIGSELEQFCGCRSGAFRIIDCPAVSIASVRPSFHPICAKPVRGSPSAPEIPQCFPPPPSERRPGTSDPTPRPVRQSGRSHLCDCDAGDGEQPPDNQRRSDTVAKEQHA